MASSSHNSASDIPLLLLHAATDAHYLCEGAAHIVLAIKHDAAPTASSSYGMVIRLNKDILHAATIPADEQSIAQNTTTVIDRCMLTIPHIHW